MDVKVRDFLARVRSGVGEQAIARLDQSEVARDLADGADEPGDLRVGCPRGEIVPRNIRALRDHQDVGRRKRIDVVERKRVLVLIDSLRRNLAAQDPREDVAVVIGLGRVDRHDPDWLCDRGVKAIVRCARPDILRHGLDRSSPESFAILLRADSRYSRWSFAVLVVWLGGASYCHGYQYLLTGGETGPWSGSLTWSAIAVVPWFALFEWSKEPQGAQATRRPAILIALVLGIAAASISLEYLVDFCVGDVTDRFGLLVMRRLPAIGICVLLITLTRKAVLRRPPNPAKVDLGTIAKAIDWIEAADNYVELHVGGRTVMRRMTMRDAEQALAGRGFIRIHRRFLVNRNKISGITGSNGDRVVRLACGVELPVGRAFAAESVAPKLNHRHFATIIVRARPFWIVA